MLNLIDTSVDNPGPRVLGHEPVILPEQREKAVEAIESTGAVNFRRERDPLFPLLGAL